MACERHGSQRGAAGTTLPKRRVLSDRTLLPPGHDLVATRLAQIPGVLGVGYGLTERAGRLTGKSGWRVYVRRKMPKSALPPAAVVPAIIGDTATDVLEQSPTHRTSGHMTCHPGAGARIANARGVPGTLGCMTITVRGELTLLTNHHVLFGDGAGERQPVWLVDGENDNPRLVRVGHTLRGLVGSVTYDGSPHFVDCAIALIDSTAWLGKTWRALPLADALSAGLAPGAHVTKTGGATGETSGIVVDVAYPDVALVHERVTAAPKQILVRSLDESRAFSADGDSGAMLRDACNALAGLVWGITYRGDTVACHVGPVLKSLGLRPAQVKSARRAQKVR